MPLEHHKFHNAKIIDQNTVKGDVEGCETEIEILHGGLPDDTTHVTLRHDKKTPDGNIILGAFVKGRDNPLVVIGKVKSVGIE